MPSTKQMQTWSWLGFFFAFLVMNRMNLIQKSLSGWPLTQSHWTPKEDGYIQGSVETERMFIFRSAPLSRRPKSTPRLLAGSWVPSFVVFCDHGGAAWGITAAWFCVAFLHLILLECLFPVSSPFLPSCFHPQGASTATLWSVTCDGNLFRNIFPDAGVLSAAR